MFRNLIVIPTVVVYSLPFRLLAFMICLAVICFRAGWRNTEVFVKSLIGEEI